MRGAPTPWPVLSRDGWLLLAGAAVRNFAYGLLSVILALHLSALGLDTVTIGAIITAALFGGAVLTLGLAIVADRLGRRRVLLAGTVLMAVAGAIFGSTAQPPWLVAAAVVGAISPSGRDVGPFLALEQAMLPQTAPEAGRTAAFAVYNLVGALASALGALAAGAPQLVGLEGLDAYRILLGIYVGCALVLLGLVSRLSEAIEARAWKGASVPWLGLSRSRKAVATLSGLFALDAFAGGFVVQSLVAYWFHLRFGVEVGGLAGIFFGANLLAALSFLAAPPLAKRIGLLNTMVFTHLPSNVLLLLLPLMPTLPLAVAVLLARHLLSQLDVPTRQSYTMAVVDPEERAAAAGVTGVARSVAAAIAPALAGPTLAVPALGLPFLLAGGLKILYDLLLLWRFRHVRPPEEQARARSVTTPAPGSARLSGCCARPGATRTATLRRGFGARASRRVPFPAATTSA